VSSISSSSAIPAVAARRIMSATTSTATRPRRAEPPWALEHDLRKLGDRAFPTCASNTRSWTDAVGTKTSGADRPLPRGTPPRPRVQRTACRGSALNRRGQGGGGRGGRNGGLAGLLP
jgi:hypothetical protein